MENREAQGLATLKEGLEKSNYEVRELLLVNHERIPEDCELLANVGPRNAALPKELELLKSYLESGGAMIALVGPRAPKAWREFFKDYGVEVRQDLLIDPYRPDNPVFVATRNYARDVNVTEDFNLITVFPEASSIRVPSDAGDEALSVRTFVSSEARTYSKAGSISDIKNIRPAANDLRGPIPMGVLIEKTLSSESGDPAPMDAKPREGSDQGALKGLLDHLFPAAHAQEVSEDEASEANKLQARVVVFSSDLFVVNGVVSQVGNLDLFMNSVNYLLQDSELIGIRPRDLRETFLKLTPQDIRKVWGFILIVAGLFLVFGVKAARRKAVVAA